VELRRYVYKLLEPEPGDRGAEKALNVALSTLIVLNVAAVIAETVPELRAGYHGHFVAFERLSVAVFSAELLARLWSCSSAPKYAGPWGRLRFLAAPLTLVDVLAILPFYLPWLLPLDARALRALRLVRLLRILKLARHMEALRELGQLFKAKREELTITAILGFILLLTASSTMYFIEHEAQPDRFSSIPASMWWGVVTLTTVGYGDVYPVTPLGRVAGAFVQVIGVGLFALPAGILAGGFSEILERRRMHRSCPHCGEPIA
jgi:voltage-gated potassium channel